MALARWQVSAMVVALIAAPVAASGADGAVGTWRGEYTCAQGSTGLTLAIGPALNEAGAAEERVQGVFFFYPLRSNPGAAKGCFDMSGTTDPKTHGIDLTAGRWLSQPLGYVTVDLAGTISQDGKMMTGYVHGPSCTRFRLNRVAAAPLAQPCRGDATMASASP